MPLRAITGAVAVALALAAPSALPQQQQQKKIQKAKPAAAAAGPKLQHQCKVGPYEKQTRLVMETVKDKPVYIAYWSSNGPFHCSFETWPGDGRARWVDSSAGTVINLIKGTMLIERHGDKYYVHARDVDRMPYCGTFGVISGVLTVPVRKGDCDWRETDTEDAGKLGPQEAQVQDADEAKPKTDQTAAPGSLTPAI
jgi:hypothetical protein